MKLTKIIVFAFTVLILAGCSNNSDVQRLKSAFFMMDNDSIDEAEMLLTIYSDTKLDEESQAIYNLAKTRLYYLQLKEVNNDSLIDYSINYYKNVKQDKYLLAESYYYKARTQYSPEVPETVEPAIKNLKDAEINALEVGNPTLIYKINESLCGVFLNSNNTHLAKEYVFKNLQLAKKEKNYNWFLYAACFAANYYITNNNNDSAYYYFDSMKPYLNTIKNDEKSEILSSIGSKITEIKPELAEQYLKESLAIKPNSEAYDGLSKLCLLKEDYEKSIEYSYEAFKYAKTPIDSIYIISNLLGVKKITGKYEEACSLYEELLILHTKEYNAERENNLVKVQAQYNVLAKEREFQDTMQKVIFGVVFIIVLTLIIFFYNYAKMMKMKENQLKDQLLLEVYNGKIKDLETSESASSAQVQNLKEKVTQLQQKQGERLSEGKKLYEHIVSGGTIISWAKQDYNNFFDYYTLIDMPFMAHMEKDYDNLSARSMIYLILCNLGKTEEEIEKIFGISNSAIRSIKSRTKSRLLNQNQED